MKFRWLLIVEAVICFLLGMSGINWITGAIGFPFVQAADILRGLSLSGNLGNIAAIVIYILLCASPLLVLGLELRKREYSTEDILLPVISILLFGGMYLMINPGLVSGLFPVFADALVWQGSICAMIWSVAIAYCVFRLVHSSKDAPADQLLSIFALALKILACVAVFEIFAVYGGSLMNEIGSAADISVGSYSADLIIACLLSFIAGILPAVMELGVIFAGLQLLDCLKDDYYSEGTLSAADALGRASVRMLAVTVTVNLVYNLLQLVLAALLMNVSVSVQLPLGLILFALAALLFARYIRQSHALKEENDSFI